MIRKSHDDFILCILKNKTMIDNPLFENNIIEDSCSLVEEARVRDIDVLLEDLPLLRGASFISQLKEITVHPSFYLVKNENIRHSILLKTKTTYSAQVEKVAKITTIC